MIEGAIFDLDMTILNSRPMWRSKMPAFLARYTDKDTSEQIVTSATLPLNTAMELFCKTYRPDLDPQELIPIITQEVAEGYKHEVDPYPDALNLIKEMRAAQIPMAIASCTPRSLIEVALKTHNLYDYFDVIASAADGHPGKHEPDVFDDALHGLGTPKETTWVFEDSPLAAKTAMNAGYHVVGFNRKQNWEDTTCLKDIVTIYKAHDAPAITLEEIRNY